MRLRRKSDWTYALMVWVLFPIVLLSGCASTSEEPPPPTVVDNEQLSEIKLPRPEPQQHREVVWDVLSFKQRAEVLRLLRQEGAFMCVTPRGYENLTHNMSEIRRWSRQMINLVEQYENRTTQ